MCTPIWNSRSLVRRRSTSSTSWKSRASPSDSAISTASAGASGRGAKKFNSDSNQFPDLYLALLDTAVPEGRGGRNAPYLKLERERIVVEDDEWDEETDEPEYRWKAVKRSQLDDAKVYKYYLDPFQTFSVYIYRCNRGRKPKSWMLNKSRYDIYSIGPDKEDDTVLGDDEDDEDDNDDVSNS